MQCWLTLIVLVCLSTFSSAVELTFELPDSAKQCFHEEIKISTKSTLEFQVINGGQYDVDLTVEDTRGKILYQGLKKPFDTFNWVADNTGVYTFCFSNEFSTFSHKLIYFDLQVGEEHPLPGVSDHLTAMTKLEQSSVNIHENLNSLIEAQTHYRLNENKGRKRAEDLNSKVLWWSIGEASVVMVVTIGQVLILKNFFSDKKGTIRT